MADQPPLDEQRAHHHFAAACFNRAWDFIDKQDRTHDEIDQMLAASQASFYHWMQFEGHTDENLSIAYWQLSRVHALAGDGPRARRYGEQALAVAERAALGAFHLGYGHEALARAALTSGDKEAAARHKQLAAGQAEQVFDAESKKLLTDDLANLGV